MKYMLLICWDPNAERKAEDAEQPGDIEAWLESVEGIRVMGNQLADVKEANTVRVRGGERLVTAGPFTETQELIGGFDIIDCDSLEQALDIAARHPVARTGSLEVRPFFTD